MVKLRPFAFFSYCKLTLSGGKHLKDVSHAHIVSLFYILLTTAKDTDEMFFDFDRDRNRRRDDLTNKDYIKGKYHVRVMLKDVSGFAEHQEKVTYGLGYKTILIRNKDEGVLDKTAGIADARIKIDQIDWYVPPKYLPFNNKVLCLNKP